VDFAAIESDLQFSRSQLARLPDRANVSRLVAMAMRPSALIVAGGMLLPCWAISPLR